MSDRGCPTESVEITGDTAPGKKKGNYILLFCEHRIFSLAEFFFLLLNVL